MAGLVPAIHAFALLKAVKTWMPGIKPGMTGALALTRNGAGFPLSRE
jgi:hypothetical protein